VFCLRENFLFFWEIFILFGDDFSFFGKIFHFLGEFFLFLGNFFVGNFFIFLGKFFLFLGEFFLFLGNRFLGKFLIVLGKFFLFLGTFLIYAIFKVNDYSFVVKGGATKFFTPNWKGLLRASSASQKNIYIKSFENRYYFATKRGTTKFGPAYDSPSRPALKIENRLTPLPVI
jgi:hypothetical protein